MAQNIITIIVFISVDIDNYHDKCHIFISFKFKARFLLQSDSCRNQTTDFTSNKYLNRKIVSAYVLMSDSVSNQETGLGCLIILIIILSFLSLRNAYLIVA